MSVLDVLDQDSRSRCAMSSPNRPMRGKTGLNEALVSPALTPILPTHGEPSGRKCQDG
jgi:hypothetical protein